MKIVCISDTHGLHKRVHVPPGDVLVHAGDFTDRGEPSEVDRFLDWLAALPHEHKVFVAGNHDFYVEEQNAYFQDQVRTLPRVSYLQDSGAVVAGLQFWGSPITPWFFDWAYNRHRGAEIREHWDLIPKDTQVLVTHGPPRGILDRNFRGENHGCDDLRDVIDQRLDRLRLHIFGHMHPGGGQILKSRGRIFVNAAICDESGYAKRAPLVVEV